MDLRFIDEALGDPGFFVDHDPHPLWKELRDNDPIHWTANPPSSCVEYVSVTRL